jgi:DNA invertase Pin-like site-specific DNA recombinase
MRKASSRSNDGASLRKTVVRCAIYTRKSSEEGLEQDFNSLDAQREACEAYVASQRSEGWIALPKMYDDGGFSGGTMERPALKELLTDIDAGLVDLVIVYKVDRLTRSLSDFAKIVDVFDAAGASFVSVTQSFNTTTSMGRLTLNMLLSFAQFEREVTGERIRDKIAASKAKGMWMGGRPPLGYEVRDRKLEIVEAEAETVRHIFHRYAELGSVFDLCDELAASGISAKRHVSVSGNVTGGGLIERGALYHLLQNHLYRGEISHKGQIYPGQHEAIVDEELWNLVQAKLGDNRVERSVRSDASQPSLLAGLLRDEDGIVLTPTHANKKGRRYRYYVSHDLIAGRKPKATTEKQGGQPPRQRSSARRIPATDLEAIVEQRLVAFLGDAAAIDAIVAPRAVDIEPRRRLVAALAAFADNWSERQPSERVAVLKFLVSGIVVTASSVEITLRVGAVVELARHAHDWNSDCVARMGKRARLPPVSAIHDGPSVETLTLTVPAFLKRVGMEMRHLIGVTNGALDRKPDRSLTRIIAQAHRFRDLLVRSNGRPFAELADECGVTTSYFTRIVRFGFLAPGITEAIVSSLQPVDLKAQKLSLLPTLPIEWQAQRRELGFG